MIRRVVWSVAGVVTAGFVAGRWPALAAALLAGAYLLGWAGSRLMTWLAVACMAAVPVAWVVGNWPRRHYISPDLVSHTPWPSRLAAIALVAGSLALACRPRREEREAT